MFSRKKKDANSQREKELTAEERAEFRDNENTKAMFSRCEEMTIEMLSDEDRLYRGDFVIGRVIWNVKSDENSKEESNDGEKPSDELKYHDHWAIVNERKEDGLDVLLITDVTNHGEKATKYFWEFSALEKHMKEGKLNLLRFNLLDIQDPEVMVIERAKNYVHHSGKHGAMQFAYQSIFGNKEPVYSDYHLSLCDPNSLLILRSDSQQKVLLLKHVQENGDGWNFEITREDEPDDTTHVLTYQEILDLIEGDDNSLFYFPGVEIESLEAVMEAQSEALSASQAVHATGETLAIYAAERALVKALVKTVGHGMRTKIAEHAGGIAIQSVVATGVASHKTVKHRRQEKLYKKTGGLAGFSRTKANREVTKTWSEAVVGTSSSVGGTFGGAAIGTMILPGVGTVVGGLVGGIAAGLAGGAIGNKAASKVYDLNLRRKCEFCKQVPSKKVENDCE